MNIYLYHELSVYGKAFKYVQEVKERTIADHKLYFSKGNYYLIPSASDTISLDPENFFYLKKILKTTEFLLIDRVRSSKQIKYPLIQIIDHRNLSGWSPLIGRTPMKNLSQFPDISRIYNKRNLKLHQYQVSTLGPKRFKNFEGEHVDDFISESVALISLAASYAQFLISAIGWNWEIDPKGVVLSNFINSYSQQISHINNINPLKYYDK